ncbi:MAG: AhpC/TSA family protein, partial [Sandaracinaceae bacterium]|nr:AhpC/TSA family protein [Sandaracinaceae bacterium]
IGYGASEDVVCRWGLFLSRSIQVGEPPRFCEPGLFLVRPDAVLHYASVQSMAFGRPDLELLLPSIDVLIEEDRPARGSVSVR